MIHALATFSVPPWRAIGDAICRLQVRASPAAKRHGIVGEITFEMYHEIQILAALFPNLRH
jgi:hypothetical protein